MAMLLKQHGQKKVTCENMKMVLNKHLKAQNMVIDKYYLNVTKQQFNGLFLSKKSAWGSFKFDGKYGKRVYKTAKALKLFVNNKYFMCSQNWIITWLKLGEQKSVCLSSRLVC